MAEALFSFPSSQECKDCSRSRKCSDYSTTAVFLSARFLPLPLSAGVFCRRAKCERTNGSSERFLPSFLPFFCYAFEMPLTRDSTDRPNSLSVVRPDFAFSVSAVPSRSKSFEVLRRAQPISIKVVSSEAVLLRPQPKLPPRPLKRARPSIRPSVRPSTPDALSLAKRSASHTRNF